MLWIRQARGELVSNVLDVVVQVQLWVATKQIALSIFTFHAPKLAVPSLPQSSKCTA